MSYTNGLDKSSEYFETKLYTGTGATHSISGLNFQPDLTWIKTRNSGADWHRLIDAVRGTTKELYSNATNAESIQAQSLQTFNTDGFTLGTLAEVNASGNTFVSWNFKANGAGVSNTAGSITSTVSASTTSGFSIVSYTGTGANATVGHGLGVAPKMIIVKSRSGVFNWGVYHESIGNTKYLELNETTASQASSTLWQNTTPTSSFFSLGSNNTVNQSSGTYIAYCFAEKKGFSKFGSYVGNGSADGTFVYTGFKPAFVIQKATSTIASWHVVDNKRNTYNPEANRLWANLSDAEGTGYNICDFVSNGFKFRDSTGGWNGSGTNFIYMAFAENPFTTSTGIPCTAR